MEPEAVFRVWATDEGPPSHSIPPHLVAKAAAALDAESFEKIHERLLKAYFTENRDISKNNVLKALWEEVDLPLDAYETRNDPEILEQVVAEHNESLKNGVSGVPAVMVEGVPGVLVGAQEEDVYRRLVRHLLGREDAPQA
jgi:predicted DsbA family dithiol-disulfide isomerase